MSLIGRIAHYVVPCALTAAIVVACSNDNATAEDPVAPAPEVTAQTVVIMNNSDQPWTGMTVLVAGKPSCRVTELSPGATLTVEGDTCETVVPEEAEVAEAAPADAPAAPQAAGVTEAPPAGEKVPLKGTFKVTGGFGPARRIGVTNTNSFNWTKCTVTLNGTWSYYMPNLAPNTYEGIMGQKFKDAQGDFMTKNHQITKVTVSCAEGSGSMSQISG
ncbi:MAG: hypothetical protein H6739_13840 [Alphaproteobacteria bacterium]|nr:hypothetical protein [Alphaproteobacteria bacterium]